ncbi:MAG TPA: DUF4337 domain-containing protein [Steroidobacteraceae bacterium]|nr:DUF4337 domain-containing protein [Steroidobacteraceae bacterium]
MAEVEIHTGHEHPGDEFGRRVGVAVGVIGIVLAVVTIGSHRAHTAAVITRTEANDQWSFYQAKKLREHLVEVSAELAGALTADPARVQGLVEQLRSERTRYAHDAEGIEADAKAKESATEREEHRALRLDMGEGFLELGLVLSSLYFLSRRRFFPLIGGVAAIVGAALGIAGLLV